MGFRFDPNKTRMTIGALDPSDYEGTLNWVQMEQPEASWDFYNVIKIDGMKGYNGSFIPWGSNLRASLSTRVYIVFQGQIVLTQYTTVFRNIKVPNTSTYVYNDGYTGPISNISIWDEPVSAEFGYSCTLSSDSTAGSPPYVALTVVINGVDYPMDTAGNMAYPPSMFSKPGFCNVAMQNTTKPGKLPNPPEVILGMPFMRSVYL